MRWLYELAQDAGTLQCYDKDYENVGAHLMHVGLIGAIEPTATQLYYKSLVKSHLTAGKKLSLTIVHADAREMIANMESEARKTQAAVFAGFIDRLKAGGCTAAALTSRGGHVCIEELEEQSSLPIISAIDALDAYFEANRVKRVGVLGARTVMESKLYGVTSADVAPPPAETRAEIHAEYPLIALTGAATDRQRRFFETEALKLFEDKNVDLIRLGGTDLYLAFDEGPYAFPLADAGLVHADAIARVAIGEEPIRGGSKSRSNLLTPRHGPAWA